MKLYLKGLLFVTGLFLSLYVTLWWCLILGIVRAVEIVQSGSVSGMDVAVTAVRIFICTPVASALGMACIYVALLTKSEFSRSRRLARR